MPVVLAPVDALDDTFADRIAGAREYDRNGRSRGLDHARHRASAAGHDHRNPATHQIGRELRQCVVAAAAVPKFDSQVLALDIAGLVEALTERGQVGDLGVGIGRSQRQPTDGLRWALLRVRAERPRRRRSGHPLDEFASPH